MQNGQECHGAGEAFEMEIVANVFGVTIDRLANTNLARQDPSSPDAMVGMSGRKSTAATVI